MNNGIKGDCETTREEKDRKEWERKKRERGDRKKMVRDREKER